MSKVKIIKKNDEYSLEYNIGDICEVTGTWYGGVHITGKSGIPVSLDKEEYMELSTEPEAPQENVPDRDIHVGDIVQHFKRECQLRPQNICIRCWLLHSIQRQEKDWLFIRQCIRHLRYAPDHTPCS